ncbi:endocuticle structural glycoprotein SgAbd-2-like [Cephus cinctus]|uniref:Endocuticle structural glycoprotein SgAbd-2-like n=1 Tax=Cephus cinctus TaxID=211228 RepID=A0AAJ7RK34_CEPCN|nr:endocuticle structural glycoprotein SgAbd-2-like [Cephus cinctus]
MKFTLVLLSAFVAAAIARPQEESIPKPGIIPVLQRDEVHDDFGQYALSYLSGDGTSMTEQGALKINSEGTGHVLVKQGSVRYYAPDGTPINLEYTADENGFQPKGSHLPTPPSVPVA